MKISTQYFANLKYTWIGFTAKYWSQGWVLFLISRGSFPSPTVTFSTAINANFLLLPCAGTMSSGALRKRPMKVGTTRPLPPANLRLSKNLFSEKVDVKVAKKICNHIPLSGFSLGGYYHGKLIFPREFPFKPPSIYMITPNGRFKCNTR